MVKLPKHLQGATFSNAFSLFLSIPKILEGNYRFARARGFIISVGGLSSGVRNYHQPSHPPKPVPADLNGGGGG